MRTMLLGAVLGAALLSPMAAYALTAYAGETLTVHAGPGANFPSLVQLGTDTRLWVHGCRQGLDWCDVSHGRMRGWVRGDRLAIRSDKGAIAEIPVASFEIRAYWEENYRREPFYGDIGRWEAGRQVAEGQ